MHSLPPLSNRRGRSGAKSEEVIIRRDAATSHGPTHPEQSGQLTVFNPSTSHTAHRWSAEPAVVPGWDAVYSQDETQEPYPPLMSWALDGPRSAPLTKMLTDASPNNCVAHTATGDC